MKVYNHAPNPIEHAGYVFPPRSIRDVRKTTKITHPRLEVIEEPEKPKDPGGIVQAPPSIQVGESNGD